MRSAGEMLSDFFREEIPAVDCGAGSSRRTVPRCFRREEAVGFLEQLSVSQQYWQLSPTFAPKVRVAIDHLRNYSVVSAQVATLREEIHGRPRRCWQALDLAKTIDISHLSAERQARYLIDLAAAHAMRPQIGEAIHDLQLASRSRPSRPAITGSPETTPATCSNSPDCGPDPSYANSPSDSESCPSFHHRASITAQRCRIPPYLDRSCCDSA